MVLDNIFVSSRLHAVTTNDNVLHLAELGRSHWYSTGCIRVCSVLVGRIRVLPLWREAVKPGNNNMASSDRL